MVVAVDLHVAQPGCCGGEVRSFVRRHSSCMSEKYGMHASASSRTRGGKSRTGRSEIEEKRFSQFLCDPNCDQISPNFDKISSQLKPWPNFMQFGYMQFGPLNLDKLLEFSFTSTRSTRYFFNECTKYSNFRLRVRGVRGIFYECTKYSNLSLRVRGVRGI